MARKQMTSEEVAEMWARYRRGETVAMLARRFDRTTSGIGSKIRQAGGIQPHLPCRANRHLSLGEREEISRGVAAGESFRQIAGRLDRAPSTVSREVAANGGRHGYRARRRSAGDRPAAPPEGVQAGGVATAAPAGQRQARAEVVP